MVRLNAKLWRISNWAGWILLPLSIVYFSTGFSMVGRYGFDRLVNIQLATKIHNALCLPFIVFFIIHVGIGVYFAIKKFKALRKK